MQDLEKGFLNEAVIKVIGVGGAGGNALNTMITSGIRGVEFIAANTDVQALQSNLAPIKVQLGRELTKGLGAGANPAIGRDAALEDRAILQEVLGGADMVFITAGMGGGTGTGAAPIIAEVARELGALTVGVVTKPFTFEGRRRKQQCELGIQNLRTAVDTLLTVPNQRLLSIAPANMSMMEGFKLADDVLLNAVKGIAEIINIQGLVNVDFADVRTIMSEMGMALMGIGTATGAHRATEAARMAISSPLLEDVEIDGATGLLINISGSSSLTLHEIDEAASLIQDAVHEDANVIFGTALDETLGDTVRVTVIATGFDKTIAPLAGLANSMQNAGSQEQQYSSNESVFRQNTNLNFQQKPANNFLNSTQPMPSSTPYSASVQQKPEPYFKENRASFGMREYMGNERGHQVSENVPRGTIPSNNRISQQNIPINPEKSLNERKATTSPTEFTSQFKSHHNSPIRSEFEELTQLTLEHAKNFSKEKALSPKDEMIIPLNEESEALKLAQELSEIDLGSYEADRPAKNSTQQNR